MVTMDQLFEVFVEGFMKRAYLQNPELRDVLRGSLLSSDAVRNVKAGISAVLDRLSGEAPNYDAQEYIKSIYGSGGSNGE